MWSFFGCRSFERDPSSLWYGFGTRAVDKKALDVAYSCVLIEQKLLWLRMWNEFVIL
jgi:hypothetical protein